MPKVNNDVLQLKTCESCGKEFGCGANLDGCWCVDVELSNGVAESLKTAYRDCLCPECLQERGSTNRFLERGN